MSLFRFLRLTPFFILFSFSAFGENQSVPSSDIQQNPTEENKSLLPENKNPLSPTHETEIDKKKSEEIEQEPTQQEKYNPYEPYDPFQKPTEKSPAQIQEEERLDQKRRDKSRFLSDEKTKQQDAKRLRDYNRYHQQEPRKPDRYQKYERDQ